LGEYCRVCNSNGAFADVDLGKPINPVKRVGGLFYVRFIMPVIAKIVIRGKIKGNPWRMIGPTYVLLPNNREMLNLFRTTFKSVESREFLMGGVIVMIGRKIPS
jgi:ubiquinone/menaquinone biosynthesis C-methylase UbiE